MASVVELLDDGIVSDVEQWNPSAQSVEVFFELAENQAFRLLLIDDSKAFDHPRDAGDLFFSSDFGKSEKSRRLREISLQHAGHTVEKTTIVIMLHMRDDVFITDDDIGFTLDAEVQTATKR